MPRCALVCAAAIPVSGVAASKKTPALLQPRSDAPTSEWDVLDQARFWLECNLDYLVGRS